MALDKSNFTEEEKLDGDLFEMALKVTEETLEAVERFESVLKQIHFSNHSISIKLSKCLETALDCLNQANTEFRNYLLLKKEEPYLTEGNLNEKCANEVTVTDLKPNLENENNSTATMSVGSLESLSYPEIILKTELEQLSPPEQVDLSGKANKSYSCDICDASVKTKVALTRHVKQNHSFQSDEVLYCPNCEYSSSNRKYFQLHVNNQHQPQDKFECSLCEYFCKNNKELSHHIAVHHEGLRYSCDLCEYSAKYINNLKEHKASKHLGITYSCEICGFTVKQKRNLKKHKENVHSRTAEDTNTISPSSGVKKNKNFCSDCPQSFSTIKGLNRHVKDVHLLKKFGGANKTQKPKNQESYSCDICKYSTTSSSSFKMHAAKHGAATKIFCDQCQYTTHNKYSFKVHQNQHLGEIFKCQNCDYQTHTRINLKRHVDVKHSVQQLSCDQCTFTSTSRHYLSNHMKKQHQEKKYSCDRCNYTSVYPSDLKSHIDAIHNKIRFVCDLCDFSAPYKGDLNRHKKTAHPVTEG